MSGGEMRRGVGGPWGWARVAAVVALWAVAGCETSEGLARREGEKARAEAAGQCAGRGGAGGGVEVPALEACVRGGCEAACAKPAGPHPGCVSVCTGMGECDGDGDCAAWRRCVVIAPRVRRCEARVGGAPPER